MSANDTTQTGRIFFASVGRELAAGNSLEDRQLSSRRKGLTPILDPANIGIPEEDIHVLPELPGLVRQMAPEQGVASKQSFQGSFQGRSFDLYRTPAAGAGLEETRKVDFQTLGFQRPSSLENQGLDGLNPWQMPW